MACRQMACRRVSRRLVERVRRRRSGRFALRHVGRSLAKARNEFDFPQYLIRASHDYPLSFVTVANVTPSMTNVASFGLPSFLLGPPAIFGTAAVGTGASLPTFAGPRRHIRQHHRLQFDLGRHEFQCVDAGDEHLLHGFLKPIDLQILDYFIRQGYSRELLFWLFTDAVEISTHGKTIRTPTIVRRTTMVAPSDDPGNRCFGELVQIAVARGPDR